MVMTELALDLRLHFAFEREPGLLVDFLQFRVNDGAADCSRATL
jgi:hypothetical protein